jgi:hypothetical protein
MCNGNVSKETDMILNKELLYSARSSGQEGQIRLKIDSCRS